MGKVLPPLKAKLVIGYIYGDKAVFARARRSCERKFGPADYESAEFDFSYSGYYGDEIGQRLKRRFVSHSGLVPLDGIHNVKLATNRIESELSEAGKRRVNIDPGYLTEAKLVLLTTKDYCHRVHLAGGIYAESTLRFRNGGYEPWDCTYPDYRTVEYLKVFGDIRVLYRRAIGRPACPSRKRRTGMADKGAGRGGAGMEGT